MNPDRFGGASGPSDALMQVRLLAVDPGGLGGLVLKGRPGAARDHFLGYLRPHFPHHAPWRRMPVHIDDDRLLGGLDIAASLASGTPVVASGLLAETDGGMLVIPMAERLPRETAARICSVSDRGEVHVERDGFTRRMPTRFGVIALDESIEEDEAPDPNLVDRLAFSVDLDSLDPAELDAAVLSSSRIDDCRRRLPDVLINEKELETLGGVSLALGITSLRGPLLAARAARVSAALSGRREVNEEDCALAIRLVLAPRAVTWPAADEETEQPQEDRSEPQSADSPDRDRAAGNQPDDLVLEAIKASIPADLLARLQSAGPRNRKRGGPSRGGPRTLSTRRGRPLGSRKGAPRTGQRLNINATLKSAAPWQRLRGAGPAASNGTAGPRFRIHPDDFQVTRYKDRTETTTLFVVDASGSAAAQRLAEAKGAVELLLAQCYVRRDQVALIAFRGTVSELLLPPTRALARAKRELAALPGGGGTPLASAIDAADGLARDLQRRGQSPLVVIMTDGRANICRDGSPGHEQAQQEAMTAARSFFEGGWNSIVVDTSRRPRPRAQSLADAMGAQYLPLPHADAGALSGLVRNSMESP